MTVLDRVRQWFARRDEPTEPPRPDLTPEETASAADQQALDERDGEQRD
jgi:hypothetical protein